MQKIKLSIIVMLTLLLANIAIAAADLEVNTPAIAAVKASMQARHSKLAAFYSSGAVGLTQDGKIAIKDAKKVPLKDRGSLNSLVAAENTDRSTLYKEIASANGHPEWQADVQKTFAGRWIDKAQGGWFYQSGGAWKQK